MNYCALKRMADKIILWGAYYGGAGFLLWKLFDWYATKFYTRKFLRNYWNGETIDLVDYEKCLLEGILVPLVVVTLILFVFGLLTEWYDSEAAECKTKNKRKGEK